MTAEQCIQIADHALANSHNYQAVEWGETALQKIQEEDDTTATMETAVKSLESFKNLVRKFPCDGSYQKRQILRVKHFFV